MSVVSLHAPAPDGDFHPPEPVGAEARAVVTRLRRRAGRRVVVVVLGLALLLLALMAVRILLGRYTVTVGDFVAILGGTQIPGASFIVLEEKLPRAVIGALAGLGLGAAGGMFRRSLRNPLASPDVLGMTHGAAAFAVGALAFGQLRGIQMAAAALLGGLAATAVVLWFSAGTRRDTRARGIGGDRFIVAGIAVAALAQAVVAGAMLSLSLHDLQTAAIWTAGSLNAASWERITMLGVALLVLLPVAGWIHWAMAPVDLGADLAHGLGTRPAPLVLGALVTGAALAAVATAATGPLAFVALMSSPIALGLTRGRFSLPTTALCGACLVVLADFVGAELLGVTLPTGVLTGAAGAPLMLWLLLTNSRRGNT
ncbi:iron chelate uptake ABC transporter family permease subunit [Tessaracoccus rhinocerotis]|nr:iron chelate uptake ABC transporter family permease subunit [Tessaracoccus rhinocerotis]